MVEHHCHHHLHHQYAHGKVILNLLLSTIPIVPFRLGKVTGFWAQLEILYKLVNPIHCRIAVICVYANPHDPCKLYLEISFSTVN